MFSSYLCDVYLLLFLTISFNLMSMYMLMPLSVVSPNQISLAKKILSKIVQWPLSLYISNLT